MTGRQEHDTTSPDPLEGIDRLIAEAWQPALRMALDSDDAPARCGRRACRMAGECRMTVRTGEPLECGGGLSEAALRTACVATLFGALMVYRFAGPVLGPRR